MEVTAFVPISPITSDRIRGKENAGEENESLVFVQDGGYFHKQVSR
jgi:hypothetical protein